MFPALSLAVLLMAFFVWKMSLIVIGVSLLQGLLWSFQIILLIISVIFCMETMRATGTLSAISPLFRRITLDRRIQALLIAFLFGSGVHTFLGFASTSGVCAILLTALGFPPWCAVILGVMGPAMGNVFSTGGVPILFSVAQGIQHPLFLAQIAAYGQDMSAYIKDVSYYVGILQGILSIFYPFLMLWIMYRCFGQERSWEEYNEIAPFAFFCGVAFAMSFALAAIFLGPEFASLIGSLVGLSAAMTAVRLGFLIPKKIWDFPSVAEWPATWTAGEYHPLEAPKKHSFEIALPFAILVTFLAAVYFPQSFFRRFLYAYTFAKPDFLGSHITLYFDPFFGVYSLLLLATGVLVLAINRFEGIGMVVGQRMTIPISHSLLELPFTMPLVCIYINSSFNTAAHPSMFTAMAQEIARLPGSAYLLCLAAPFFSATTAHYCSSVPYGILSMTSFQDILAHETRIPSAFFVALLVCGASMGGLFTTHYLVGCSISIEKTAFVGPTGRKMILPMLISLSILSITGFVMYLLYL